MPAPAFTAEQQAVIERKRAEREEKKRKLAEAKAAAIEASTNGAGSGSSSGGRNVDAPAANVLRGLDEISVEERREVERRSFLRRGWIDAGSSKREGQETMANRALKVVSWNPETVITTADTGQILAQTLIRRDLFPSSDCLRWGDRRAMLEAELQHYCMISDIVCLQECDRLKELMHSLPIDECVQAKGRGKQHGLVVLYRSSRFTFKASKVIHLDEEALSPIAPSSESPGGSPDTGLRGEGQMSRDSDQTGDTERKERRGGTRQTKNVGLIVALHEADDPSRANSRLILAQLKVFRFWHPKFQYERVRQMIILLRSIRAFQAEHNIEHWPSVIAGDLNTSPSEAPYQLLVNPSQSLPPHARARLEESRIVHSTVERMCAPPPIPVSDPPQRSDRLSVVNGEWVNSSSSTPAAASLSGTGANTPTGTTSTGAALPQVAQKAPGKETEEKDDEGELPDSNEKSIANTRAPTTRDGILSIVELQGMMSDLVGLGLRSTYGSTFWHNPSSKHGDGTTNGGDKPLVHDTFESRGGWEDGEVFDEGGNEVAYSCYTPLFKLTLDYLFILPGRTGDLDVRVKQILEPARKEDLGKGLPMKGICASDHLAVGCEIAW